MSWFNDLFTDINLTNLTAHTSDSGASWSLFGGNSTSPKIYATAAGAIGVVASGATAAQLYRASQIAPQADVVMSASIYFDSSPTTANTVGIACRLDAGGTTGYMAVYNTTTGVQQWQIHRVGTVPATTLIASSSTVTYANASTHAIEFSVTGSGATVTLVLKVDGVQVISTTDTSGSRVTAAGYPGVWFSTAAGIAVTLFINSLSGDIPVVAAANVTMTGPTSGSVGVASTNFTAGADGTITGTVTVTPSDGGAGGSFTPTTVNISSGTPTATFTYTAASIGAKTISCTNNGSLGNPANITYTASSSAATAVTMSGPSGGLAGVASTNFTVGANGVITGTVVVTPSDGGAGGTFTPTSKSISSGTPTGTFTYTPASAGAKTISVTNNGSLTNPSNITYTATAAATAVTLSGPSAGAVSAASSNFTAGVNGGLAANVTVTPNDSSGGGTFAPTSVTLTPGAPNATFTYTPASTGVKTVAVTNGSGLTNPSSISYTVTGVVTAPFPLKFADRVRDTASAASGGSITLNGAPPAGYRAFASAFTTGDKRIPVTVVDQGNAAWMCCYVTYTSSTLLTVLSIASSSAGGTTAPTFSGSTKDVIHGPIADAGLKKRFIDLADYAVYPDFSSDSTAGIQQAVLDAYAWDIEKIMVPPGRYKIAGALTGSGNCQIYIPQTREALPHKSIYFEGMSPPNFEQQGIRDVVPATNGCIFESTIAGSGTRPSVIGMEQGNAGDTAGWIWNYTNVGIKNLGIRTKLSAGANSMSALNFEFAAQVAHLDMLRIDVDCGLTTSATPNSNSVGIIMPPVNNHLLLNIGMVYISGYYTGIRAGEHTKIDSLIVIGANRGIELQTAFHGTWIGLYSAEHVKYAIWMAGNHPLAIGHYDAEHDTNFSWGTFSEDLHVASGTRKVAILRSTVVVGSVGYDDNAWVDNASGLMHKTVCGAGAN